MERPDKILVCGASPDNRNRNMVLRNYVAEGFELLLGADAVVNTPLEHAAVKVSSFKPDAVVCFGSCMPDDADYQSLRWECDKQGIPMVFWLHDDPYEFDYHYKLQGVADIIFSNDRWSAEHYNHPRAFHLPLAASESAHKRDIQATEKHTNIFFCGVAFPNRARLLRDLAPTLSDCSAVILGAEWPTDLGFCENRRLPNEVLSQYYNESWVTLNMGRDFNYANDRFKLDPSTPGPRTFEAAMSGTTQAFFVESLEIMDYYRPGTEVLLYNSAVEFKQMMEQMRDDRERCLQIAISSQQRTMTEHTYKHRAETILMRLAEL